MSKTSWAKGILTKAKKAEKSRAKKRIKKQANRQAKRLIRIQEAASKLSAATPAQEALE